jgi:hypothetical protein
MKNCQFVNNRGFTFDGGGGSWLGPIFWKNLGMTNTFSLKNLIVKNCTLSRNTGNCIWGHQNAFNTMSTNITMSGCSFENCGLDGIEIGGAENVSISNSVFHRQGVVAVDDTSDPLPVYVPGAGACCIDTTSNVTQATYTNCSMTSLTGCGVDLDGLWNGVISNMTISQPLSTDPLYTLDHIGVCGPSGAANAAYGIQTGNTYPPLGGQDVVITNNVISNMGTRAISLQNARKCKVSLNHVWHSGSASEQPVILFPVDKSETNGGTVGLAGQNACWGCKVENNTMIYGSDTPASAFCVAEVKHRNGLDGGECQQGNPTPILSEQTNQTLTAPSGQTVTVPFAPLQRTVPTPSDNWDAGVHVDYHLSNNMQLMGKFYDQQHTAPYAGGGTSGYFYGTPSHSKQAGGSWVWTINPTTVNEFRFSFIKSEYYDCGGNTYNFTELTQNVASVGIRAFRVMGWPTIFRNTGSSTATSIRTA